jgi:hypothetical protein
MQDEHAVLCPGEIDHPIGTTSISNPQLLHTLAYGLHGLEVIWFQAALKPIQLESCLSARILGEAPEPFLRVTEKIDGFHVLILYLF